MPSETFAQVTRQILLSDKGSSGEYIAEVMQFFFPYVQHLAFVFVFVFVVVFVFVFVGLFVFRCNGNQNSTGWWLTHARFIMC